MNISKLSPGTSEEFNQVLLEWKESSEKNRQLFAKYIKNDNMSFDAAKKLCEKINDDAEKEGTDWMHYLAKDDEMRDILLRVMEAEIAYAKHQKEISKTNK